MSSIYDLLAQIQNAVYGKDVRGSIHDAIEQCYEDATGNPASLSNLISSLHDLGDVIEMDATTVGPIAPGTGYHFDDDTIYLEPGSWILEFGISVDPSAGTSGAKGILTFASIDPYWNHPDQERYFNYDYGISNTFRHYTFVDEDNPIWDNVIVEEGDNQGKAPVYLYLSNDVNGISINVYLFVRAICLKKQGSDEPGGSIEEQVAQNTADISLLNEEVADVKADLQDLQEEIEGGGSGLTADLKAALDQLAQKVAYIDEDGQTYYDALHAALYPPANLTRISCVYTQSGTVYDTDTLDSLKADLVVTAHFDNGTTQTVTTYTLSGTLAEGTSTITVSYGGKTTTFNVTVSASPSYITDGLIHHYDGINNTGSGHDSSSTSWKDLVGTLDLTTITNATWADDGLTFTGVSTQAVSSDSNLTAQSETTIEMVVEPLATGTQMVCSFDSDGNGSSKRFAFYSDNTIGFVGKSGLTYSNSESSFTYIRTLSATYSGYTFTGGYVNNTQVSQSNKSHSFNRNKSTLLIGNVDSSDGTKYPFTGKVMAIRIYNRQLSVSELTQNHAVDVARFGLGA